MTDIEVVTEIFYFHLLPLVYEECSPQASKPVFFEYLNTSDWSASTVSSLTLLL